MNKTATILGYGPAAMFAAWGALYSGWKVRIIAESFAKPMAGATAGVFVLHDSMELPLRSARMTIRTFGGSQEDYRQKVYGEGDLQVSMPNPGLATGQLIWDAEQAIDMADDIIRSALPEFHSYRFSGDYEDVENDVRRAFGVDGPVISTLPLINFAPALCQVTTTFVTTGEAPADECYMLYNAHPDMAWYRASAAFGRFTMEWVENPRLVGPEARPVRKVVARLDDVEPGPAGFKLVGRYGRWEKGYLSHQAFEDAIEFLRKW